MLMNPPAPTQRGGSSSAKVTSPTTAALHRRAGLNPPAPSPLVSQRHHEKGRDKTAQISKAVKRSSRSRYRVILYFYYLLYLYLFIFILLFNSSSGSESSGSSSDSSESSYSSSSSVDVRRKKIPSPPSPTINRKESTKHIDPKNSNTAKQHLKIPQKPTNTATVKKSDRSGTIAGKKRPFEPSPPTSESKASIAALAAKAAKKASSRREELLKQLKAVEDAIARKRSKPETAGKN